jgi:hypothetical protein
MEPMNTDTPLPPKNVGGSAPIIKMPKNTIAACRQPATISFSLELTADFNT